MGQVASPHQRCLHITVEVLQRFARDAIREASEVKGGSGQSMGLGHVERKVERKVRITDGAGDVLLLVQLGNEEGSARSVVNANVAANIFMVAYLDIRGVETVGYRKGESPVTEDAISLDSTVLIKLTFTPRATAAALNEAYAANASAGGPVIAKSSIMARAMVLGKPSMQASYAGWKRWA